MSADRRRSVISMSYGVRHPVVAAGMVLSVATYQFGFAKSASAAVPAPAPAAMALDDSSVSPLLALDKAMETLAARVTPAIVNVTVTSKVNADRATIGNNDSDDDNDDDIQKFFGRQFGRQFGQRMQPQPQYAHGLGSGVIISPD